MIVQICNYVVIPDNGGGLLQFIDCSGDEPGYRIVLVFGLDQTAKVMEELDPGSEHTPNILAHFAKYGMLQQARQLNESFDGIAAWAITRMCMYFQHLVDGHERYCHLRKPGVIVAAFFSADPLTKEAVLAYCDSEEDHHVAIVSSKEQARDLLISFDWLDDGRNDQMSSVISRCGLPEESSVELREIEGGLAKYINQSYATEERVTSSVIN
jgi:hypothetical protein